MEVHGHIKFTIVKQASDEIISEMPVQPGILNPFGTVNAGATLWFADVTASVLLLQGLEVEEKMQGFPLAINLNANFLGNSRAGTFVAKSNYVKKGRSVSVVRTTVTDLDGNQIADVTTSHVPSR